MSEPGNTQALRDQHAHLHTQIEEEERRLAPDPLKLKELKQQKLRIKDEIALANAH